MKIRQSCSILGDKITYFANDMKTQIHLLQEPPWAPSAIHELQPSANIPIDSTKAQKSDHSPPLVAPLKSGTVIVHNSQLAQVAYILISTVTPTKSTLQKRSTSIL